MTSTYYNFAAGYSCSPKGDTTWKLVFLFHYRPSFALRTVCYYLSSEPSAGAVTKVLRILASHSYHNPKSGSEDIGGLLASCLPIPTFPCVGAAYRVRASQNVCPVLDEKTLTTDR